jgi:hypothetical protein
VLAERAGETHGVPRHQSREQVSTGSAGLRPGDRASDFS